MVKHLDYSMIVVMQLQYHYVYIYIYVYIQAYLQSMSINISIVSLGLFGDYLFYDNCLLVNDRWLQWLSWFWKTIMSFPWNSSVWWFPESYGYPQSSSILIGCSWIFYYKSSILGYPHFRKPLFFNGQLGDIVGLSTLII